MELIPAVVMTTDVIVHPHIYEFQSIDDWSWEKDTREKANGLVSSIRRFENIVLFVNVQKNYEKQSETRRAWVSKKGWVREV